MNRLHMNIVMLESEVYSQLTARGFLCDSVDPLTGCSMHSRSGSRYSEVYSAHKLLGYQILEANGIRITCNKIRLRLKEVGWEWGEGCLGRSAPRPPPSRPANHLVLYSRRGPGQWSQ